MKNRSKAAPEPPASGSGWHAASVGGDVGDKVRRTSN